MNHETFHELLALRLYGELSSDEERLLAGHLATCADCRLFGDELGRTLGLLAPESVTRELPADWRERLSARIASARRRRWLQPLATFAAGLAAGWLVTAALRPAGVPPATPERLDAPPFVLLSDPPPPATGRGQLARLSEHLGR